MGDPGRRTPRLGGLAETSPLIVKRRTLSIRSKIPPVVALIISAARARPIHVRVPPGVTVYEIHSVDGVRLLRQGGAFWDPSLVPQRRWLWAFKNGQECREYHLKYPEIHHEIVAFYRSRERIPRGHHPLEHKVFQNYLFGQLERAVEAETEARYSPSPGPEAA